MIEFKNVYKSFGTKKVLQGLSFSVQTGELFFILGRSGTGKSVALKHLVGLLKPDKGEIFLEAKPVHNCEEHEFVDIRKDCGIVFQLPALVDSRSVFENLCLGIRFQPLELRIKKLKEALISVDLEDLIEHMHTRFPPELSYGEQKRVSLARTLLVEPRSLLYDEPTTGLDLHTSKNIHKLIRDISKKFGKTSIVVSHDMENALSTADTIAVLESGRVVDLGSPDDIRKSKVPMTQAFLKGVV